MNSFTEQGFAWTSMSAPSRKDYPPTHQLHHQPRSSQRTQHQQHHHPSSSVIAPHHVQERTPIETSIPTYPRSYETYLTPRDDESHLRGHTLGELYTTQLPEKKRTQHKMYPSEEARQAAKAVQKARRREQNRNAQRRLRDRKEEHIFKLEGDVAQLRRQAEQHRSDVQILEEMIRRLLDQRQHLERKLDALGIVPATHPDSECSMNSSANVRLVQPISPTASLSSSSTPSSGSRRFPVETLPTNALYLTDYDPTTSSRSCSSSSVMLDSDGKDVSPLPSSASSASISTPRSPCFLSLVERGRSCGFRSPRESMAPLPRIKIDPSSAAPLLTTALPPPVTSHWNLHH